jgi:glycosyltransferase involved in cell wall biosynthesis
MKRVWERVDRFLCPSQFLAERLVDFGVPSDKVIPFPNFIEPGPEPGPWKPGEGWLFAGRLTPEKGVDVVIEAARLLPQYPLWICGTGPDIVQLKERAQGMNHVHFMGHLPHAELTRRMASVGAVSVPSRWYENFPYAVLEAQALARPVVASRIGGIPEQIESGIDGLLVPPNEPKALADAISQILSDPVRAQSMAEAGADRVRSRLYPAEHMERLLGLYNKLLGSSRSTS